MLLRLILVLIALLAAGSARAQDEAFAEATWGNLLHTMVRFNVLDLNDPGLIDEYGIIEECEMYKAFYHDDFKWNQVRQALRQSAKLNVATYPTLYHYDAKVQLDRYDFAKKIYRFTAKSLISNVNAFTLFSVQGTNCGNGTVKYLPRIFRAVIPTAIYMEGLPLTDRDAEAVLHQMDADGNTGHVAFVRFGLRITYIDPLKRKVEKTPTGDLISYTQSVGHESRAVRFDADLDDIEFYADPGMTTLIYKFQP